MGDATHVTRWHLITGEYPPAPGGVSDYTRQLAVGIAQRGEPVEIWAPEASGSEPNDPGIVVHRLSFVRARTLAELGKTIAASKARERLFVQYVPQAFGHRGMNVDLIRWLVRQPAELWVHPRGRPDGTGLPPSTRPWRSFRADGARGGETRRPHFPSRAGGASWETRQASEWLPIPSNVPTTVPELVVARTKGAWPRSPVATWHLRPGS
jgi:hypothetical protein